LSSRIWPMATETEAKLKVDSHEEIITRLGEAGARFLGEQLHTDIYFDDAQRSLTKADKCLRVRISVVGGKERFYLTYKGPKQIDDYKKREEIETEVKDADALQELLAVLGYEKALSFEKKRLLWRLGQCGVSLDQVPALGMFVEVEGPNGAAIADAQDKLGLGGQAHIQHSYATLIADKLGLARPEVEL